MSTYAPMSGGGQKQVAAPKNHKWRKPIWYSPKSRGDSKTHAQYLADARKRAKEFSAQ